MASDRYTNLLDDLVELRAGDQVPADGVVRASDGLELDEGTRVFGRGELRDVSEWLVLEKGLAWSDDLVIVGERRDIVIVLDLDVRGERAGGGVLETGIDDLGAFERVACDVVGYLCIRAGVPDDVALPPEIAARRAAASSPTWTPSWSAAPR